MPCARSKQLELASDAAVAAAATRDTRAQTDSIWARCASSDAQMHSTQYMSGVVHMFTELAHLAQMLSVCASMRISLSLTANMHVKLLPHHANVSVCLKC